MEECDGMEQEPVGSRGILEPGAEDMVFRRTVVDPHPELSPFVERHWIVRWSVPDAFTQSILPHPCVNLTAEPGLIAVYGIPLERSEHRLADAGMVVGTKFLPGGFAGFSETAPSLLNDRIVPLAEPFGAAGAGLERELGAVAGDPEAHIAAVESHLLARLPDPDPRYDLVRVVVADMLAVPPATTVTQLSRRHAVTARTLQRAFNDFVGVSPKWVLKRYRMHTAAERIAAGDDDLAALAADLGYFDQAHFTRDFGEQVGTPPAEYAKACAAMAGRATAARLPQSH